MKRTIAVFGLFLLITGYARAQEEGGIRLGAQISYGDAIQGDGIGLGGRATWALDDWSKGVAFTTSFDYYFPESEVGADDASYFELNGNLTYAFVLGNGVSPFLGAGVNFARGSHGEEALGFRFEETQSSVGLNLLGGIRFPKPDRRFTPFAEIKTVLGGDFEPVIVTGGIQF